MTKTYEEMVSKGIDFGALYLERVRRMPEDPLYEDIMEAIMEIDVNQKPSTALEEQIFEEGVLYRATHPYERGNS